MLPVLLKVSPTAQALRAEAAATPESSELGAGLGLGTCFHAAPFHRRITVPKDVAPVMVSPTAQALRAETAATLRSAAPPAGGLGTRFHTVPFHRRIRLGPGPQPQLMSPTAQALLADVTATPLRKSRRPLLAPGLGLGTCFHALPFHRRIRVLMLMPAV